MLVAAPTSALALKGKLFRGLADPSRLAILETLRPGPCTVTEIVAATGLRQSNASNHLSCLLDCGLVAREQRGHFVWYRLSDPRVADLLAVADALLVEVATGVVDCLRYETEKQKGAAQ